MRSVLPIVVAGFLLPTAFLWASELGQSGDDIGNRPQAVRVSLEGEIRTLISDHEDGTTEEQHFFHASDGQTYMLETDTVKSDTVKSDGAAAIPRGLARVTGMVTNKILAVEQITGKGAQTKSTQGWTTRYGFGVEPPEGPQKTLVVFVNFPDDTGQSMTVAEAEAAVFTDSESADLRLQAMSGGSASLTGDVLTSWWTLPFNKDDCENGILWQQTLLAALANGVDLAAYDRHVTVYKSGTGCSSAAASFTDSPSWAQFKGTFLLSSNHIIHELGHNHGLRHTHRLDNCSNPTHPTRDTCSYSNYGHRADPMGITATGYFSPMQLMRLGWMGTDGTDAIQSIGESGTFSLEPVAGASNGVKALVIPRSYDSATGVLEVYVVEYRQPVSFDSGLSSLTDFIDGLVINLMQLGGDEPENKIYMLDTSPGTSGNTWDQTLQTTESFTDSTAGITITHDSRTATAAQVTVTFTAPGGTCAPAAPTVVVAPWRTKLGAGETNAYDVTVTNNDVDCGPSSFAVTAGSLPVDWSAQTMPSALPLPSGATATLQLRITSDGDAAIDAYTFDVSATDEDDASHTTTVSTTYGLTGCMRSAPLGNIIEDVVEVGAGQETTVTVELTNQNAGDCEDLELIPTTFLPYGWTADSIGSPTVATGETVVRDWDITPSADAPVGEHVAAFMLKQWFESDGTQQFGVDFETVRIKVVACEETTPAITVSPGMQTGAPGEALSYTITVSNENNVACADETFNLGASLPTDWSGGLDVTTMTLASGGGDTATLTVTSEVDAADGDYDISLTATGQGSVLEGSNIAQYTVFDPDRTLTVVTAGGGSGNITSSPSGIDCGSSGSACSAVIDVGTDITLTATPDTGSELAGWTGDADCTDGVVTMDDDRSCTATFELQTGTLSFSFEGPGDGIIETDQSGFECSSDGAAPDCDELLTVGTIVTFTASPTDADSTFDGWSGDVDCEDGQITIAVEGVGCTAIFGTTAFFYDGFETGDTSAW